MAERVSEFGAAFRFRHQSELNPQAKNEREMAAFHSLISEIKLIQFLQLIHSINQINLSFWLLGAAGFIHSSLELRIQFKSIPRFEFLQAPIFSFSHSACPISFRFLFFSVWLRMKLKKRNQTKQGLKEVNLQPRIETRYRFNSIKPEEWRRMPAEWIAFAEDLTFFHNAAIIQNHQLQT